MWTDEPWKRWPVIQSAEDVGERTVVKTDSQLGRWELKIYTNSDSCDGGNNFGVGKSCLSGE